MTGAARGIGAEIVKAALNAGDKGVATAREPRKIEQTCSAGPDRLLALPLDVTQEDQVTAAVDTAIKHFGKIDVLVNNAGYGQLGGFEETTPDQIRAQYDPLKASFSYIPTNLFSRTAPPQERLMDVWSQRSRVTRSRS